MNATIRPRGAAPALVTSLPDAGLLALAALSFIGHMLVAGNYGYFRDELYYIADGWHLQLGYVDQPLLMGWLAALLRATIGNGLVAIHVVPAVACALLIVVTGLLARELGGGRTAQRVAGLAALFNVVFMVGGSIFSMDVLDQLWWGLASLVVAALLRRDAPRLWLLVGLIAAVALLTKLTVLFFGLALALALLTTPERRHLRTRWPWLGGAIACLGLLPYLVWNATNGWPTLDFWRHYSGIGTSPPAFLLAQIGQLNPVAVPLAVAGLAFYFRGLGRRFRLLGWTFVLVYLLLTLARTKTYFLAPAYPILLAAGALVLERLAHRPRLGWVLPVYLVLLAAVGVLLAPAVMPILPPATVTRVFGSTEQVLSDRLGWDSLTLAVEQVYAHLSPAQRAHACVLTSNYGEASALLQLAAPGGLPPVISGHNNYYLWGPDTCTGQVLIVVGYSLADFEGAQAHVEFATTARCQYCAPSEQDRPIVVVSDPTVSTLAPLWPSVKHYD